MAGCGLAKLRLASRLSFAAYQSTRKSLSITEITTNDDVEVSAVDVLVHRDKYRFTVVYRPPSHDAIWKMHVVTLVETLTSLCAVKGKLTSVGKWL